jgi:hypothetical protein
MASPAASTSVVQFTGQAASLVNRDLLRGQLTAVGHLGQGEWLRPE